MPKLSDLKLPKLSNDAYKDVKFRLHFITDISTKPGENYYNAIFKSIKARADFDIQEKIYPELLNYYVIGNIYQQGERIDKSKYLELLRIKFPLLDGKILKIKEINEITNHSIVNNDQRSKRSIENQYAYLGVFDGYYVIIPCHVIGSAFYFTSTTMRERIFDSKIQSLYHETGIDKEKGYPYALLKTGVPDSDAAFIYFYANNKYASLKWHSIRNNMYAEKKSLEANKRFSSLVPLKIDFPIQGSFYMDVLALKDESSKRIFVYKILNAESSIYNYEKIIIRRYRHKGIEENIRDVSQNIIYRTKTKETGIISNEAPSYRNSIKIIEDDDDDDFFGIEKIKEIISKEGGAADNNNVDFISAKEAKDISFNSLRDGKNSGVRPGETKKTKSYYFTFDDFKELIEMFLNKYSEFVETESVVISNPAKFPAAKNKKHFNKKESYDGKNLRDYITARFEFKADSAGKNVLLIELSQRNQEDSDKGFSIFIFIADKYIDSYKEKDFLRKYAANINFGKIENYFKSNSMLLIRKKHPDKSNKNNNFKAWCEDLYRKIKIP
jgi:hypothetical protein